MSDLMVAALQAQVADLKLARKQANEVVAKLMGSKLTDQQRDQLFHMILQHCMEQDNSKANQLTAVIRTAVMQLNAVALSTADQVAKQRLVEVIKALTLTVECATVEITTQKVENGKQE